MNDPVHIHHPGFQHRFLCLYVIIFVASRSRSTCRHVDPSKTLRILAFFWLAYGSFQIFSQFLTIPFALFQQLTGEHKQMAKAMAKATKAASKAPAFKKRSASSSVSFLHLGWFIVKSVRIFSFELCFCSVFLWVNLHYYGKICFFPCVVCSDFLSCYFNILSGSYDRVSCCLIYWAARLSECPAF